jgi:DNA-binding GntR family transcriptional regulator
MSGPTFFSIIRASRNRASRRDREAEIEDHQNGDSQDPPRGGSTPRYLQLARVLQDAIQSGAYPVGSLLPTEIDLSLRHDVSRHTVRQAIGQLRQQGLLTARKGVGTRIEARQGTRRFTYSALSATDLVEIATDTELTIERSEWVRARGPLAAELGCRAGHRWQHLGCTRRADGDERPLSWTEIYVDGRLAEQLSLPRTLRTALFVLLEKQSGEMLTEIQQEIRATVIDATMAARLDADPGAPALEITRRYFSTGRRLVLVAVNTLPADRFFYSVEIKRD